MIRSMTGYGRREGAWQGSSVIVEVKSVNHRFLDIAFRTPRSLTPFEDQFRKMVQRHCDRGRIDVSIHIQGGTGLRSLSLDRQLAKQYYRTLRELQSSLGLAGPIEVSLIAELRDVVTLSEEPIPRPQLSRLAQRLLTGALGDLVRMRQREGAVLAKDLTHHLEAIRSATSQIKAVAPTTAQASFDRMKARVEALLQGDVPDLPRLHQELAVYADRGDISEELVRLSSHVVQFRQTMKSRGAAGKTLEFLLQEMGRETNTIGSKSSDLAITALVVGMKASLEKLREQVQNVE